MPDLRCREQIKSQMTFLGNSCAAYDAGQISEAVRIATVLRVLLHNTSRSISLLKHLQAEDIPLLSTCRFNFTVKTAPPIFDGLVLFSAAGITPKLGSGSTSRQMTASDWWNQLVVGIGNGRALSRRDIALTAANKDGGTHVDSDIPTDYAQLVEGIWTVGDASGEGLVADHHAVCLRQMGFEILNSPALTLLAVY